MPLVVVGDELLSFFLSGAAVPWEASVVLNIEASPVRGVDVKIGYDLNDDDKTPNIALNFNRKRHMWLLSGVSYYVRRWCGGRLVPVTLMRRS